MGRSERQTVLWLRRGQPRCQRAVRPQRHRRTDWHGARPSWKPEQVAASSPYMHFSVNLNINVIALHHKCLRLCHSFWVINHWDAAHRRVNGKLLLILGSKRCDGQTHNTTQGTRRFWKSVCRCVINNNSRGNVSVQMNSARFRCSEKIRSCRFDRSSKTCGSKRGVLVSTEAAKIPQSSTFYLTEEENMSRCHWKFISLIVYGSNTHLWSELWGGYYKIKQFPQ